MSIAALGIALGVTVQDRVPQLSLGPRTGAIAEPFSDADGDGRVVVSDRVEKVFALADFTTGAVAPSAGMEPSTSTRSGRLAGEAIRYSDTTRLIAATSRSA